MLGASPVKAADWIGGTSTNWFDASNWNPAAVPGSGTAVNINNGSTATPVVIDAAGAQSGGLKLGSSIGSVGALQVTGAGRITDTGTYFIVGDHGEGAVTVSNGGQVTTRHAVVANYPNTIGNVFVTGTGSQWSATELTVSYDANAIGSFVVNNGGKLQIANPGGNAFVTLGRDSTAANGTLTVTGSGSSFIMTNGVAFNIGAPGRGVFNVLDGASADTSAIVNINSLSEAHVSGTGSIWSSNGLFTNSGTLTVTDGGTLGSNSRVSVGPTGTATIADGGTLTTTLFEVLGTTTVRSGGTLSSSGNIWIGSAGSGVLTLADGGTLRATDPTKGIGIGNGTGTDGTLIIGAQAGQAATAPGSVEAPYVVFEGSANPGTRTLIFNHTASDYVFTPYITGGSGKGTVDVLAGTTTLAGGVNIFDGTINISSGATLKITGKPDPFSILPVETKNDGTLVLNSNDFFTDTTANISGTGKVVKTGSGWLTLTGENSWSGGTEVQEGRLYVGELIGSEPQDGTLVGNVLNNGQLIFRRKTDYTFGGAISGSGSFEKEGAGTLTLTGQSTYTGDTTVWSGSLALGADDRLPSTTTLRLSGGTFDLNGHTQTVGNLSGFASGVLAIGTGALTTVTSLNSTLPSDITGTGDFIKQGTATLTLNGAKNFAGTTTVDAGALLVNGSMAASQFQGNTGGTLGGSGSIGATTVADGGILAGQAGQTLTMASLDLSQNSKVNAVLGTPNTTALFNVAGNLKLDGTLDVTDAGGFGAGIYRIFGYNGTLTNNGLDVGSMPTGTTGAIQTSVANQVNLLVDGSPATQFWNGMVTVADNTIHGGSGTWKAGPTNWTDVNGTTAYAWGSQFAVFQNNPGTVNVDTSAGAIPTTGMQFIGTGWSVIGGAIALNGASGNTIIRVGDGTVAGAAHTATIASELTGSSRLVKNDLGTLILTGTNSYAAGTTIAAGTLQIGNGGTSGSITGDVLNNAALAFNRSDATTFGGIITGSGVLQLMSGKLTLTANSNYAGGTDIAAGSTLQLGNGGMAGAITGNVTNNGTLAFNQSSDWTFGGLMSGGGTLRQIGSGNTVLTGDSSGFTGVTMVENGMLTVNGRLSNSATTVNAGSTLGGTGTVGSTTVSGTIAPGLTNAIGTLNVNGLYTQTAGSLYNVKVNAAGASDLLNITGATNIGGGTVHVLAGVGNYDPTTVYKILTSSGTRSGAFDGVTSNFAFLDPSLSYDLHNVYLTLVRNSIDFSSIGGTRNQIAAGGGVQTLGLGNAIADSVLGLSVDQARAAFDSVSGEIHPSLHSLMLNDSALVRDAIFNRERQGSGLSAGSAQVMSLTTEEESSALGYATKARKASAPKWPVKVPAQAPVYEAWAQGYGNWGHIDGDGNAAKLNYNSAGAVAGVDVTFNRNWRLGFAAGGGSSNANVNARTSSGTLDTFHLAVYGSGSIADIVFRTGATYSHHDVSTTRAVSFPGFSDATKANYDASTSQIFGEAAYRLMRGWMNAEAFGNVAYVSVHNDAFTESGGLAALGVSASTTADTLTTLGVRGQAPIAFAGPWTVVGRGSLGWQHAFGDTTPQSLMSFAAASSPFTIAGVPIARDMVLVETGIDAAAWNNVLVSLIYSGRLANDASAHAAKANLTVKF